MAVPKFEMNVLVIYQLDINQFTKRLNLLCNIKDINDWKITVYQMINRLQYDMVYSFQKLTTNLV